MSLDLYQNKMYLHTMLQQIAKKRFYYEGPRQGHTVIDLGVIGKGIISGVCIPNANLVENKQDKNKMPLIIRSGV